MSQSRQALALGALLLTFAAGYLVSTAHSAPPKENARMELGNFSVSLAVKDLGESRAFYEKLGFAQVGGDAAQNWLILQNGTTTIGLFQGMFEKNIMTFNPGWNHKKETLDDFMDVRAIQAKLKEMNVPLIMESDPASDGPAHVVLEDPDGNQILIDQHVPKPGN